MISKSPLPLLILPPLFCGYFPSCRRPAREETLPSFYNSNLEGKSKSCPNNQFEPKWLKCLKKISEIQKQTDQLKPGCHSTLSSGSWWAASRVGASKSICRMMAGSSLFFFKYLCVWCQIPKLGRYAPTWEPLNCKKIMIMSRMLGTSVKLLEKKVDFNRQRWQQKYKE